ncbi:hypothetical protein SLE2022_307090 [Rubroshorea leprosula]
MPRRRKVTIPGGTIGSSNLEGQNSQLSSFRSGLCTGPGCICHFAAYPVIVDRYWASSWVRDYRHLLPELSIGSNHTRYR